MISIKHLKKEYAGVTPLSDVSVEVEKGEVISVIGPSGTGKSTLLRCLNLLETPTAGEIWVKGENITAKGADISAVRRRMGMVFQSFNLFSHLTVIENITLAPVDLLKLSRQEAYDEGMRLLETVGLAEKAFNYPDELSGGQKQRVAIARALAMQPEIILFDEPTSALDPTMVGEVLSVIRALAREGLTMMIVTHEMKFARDVSTRILYMDEGGIYEDGTPEEIFDRPQRERTRAFVRRLKTLEKQIASPTFDFIEMCTAIEEFGRKQLLAQRQINNLQLAFEELCVQTLLKWGTPVFPMRFTASVSELDGACEAVVSYGGPEYNPFATQADDLSIKLVSRFFKGHRYSAQDGNSIALAL
ncbi:MAG TPA: amino acid ABC transporter ATP-binding protein [Clostridia bacterium]|nr:amino acid ABC transporter ATP-binding protein [Clostridia bacterium]